jgi:hypothetical protein
MIRVTAQYVASLFSEVRDYVSVSNGLPEGHYCCDKLNEDFEGERRPSKVWSDTDSSTGEHNYDLYYQDKEVKNAARFRDGLVSNVYKQFDQDFRYSFWADEYKKHSTIVYKYETGAPSVQHPFCTHDTHTTYLNNGLCSESIDQINLMVFQINSIEGDQSQVCIRDKIFSVLHDDIKKLPNSPFKVLHKLNIFMLWQWFSTQSQTRCIGYDVKCMVLKILTNFLTLQLAYRML